MPIKNSPSMTVGGLPVAPGFGSKPKPFPRGSTASDTFTTSVNPALNKGPMKRVTSRFYMKDRQGRRGAVEVAYFSSSNVAIGAYDHAKKVLTITFKGRGRPSVYSYFQVPKEFWEAMKRASSVGRFHYTAIRKRFYYKRIR